MKKVLLFVAAFVMTATFANAQRTLLNFDDVNLLGPTCFGTGNPEPDSTCLNVIMNPDPNSGASAMVGEYIEPGGQGEPWMGMFMDLKVGDDPIALTAGQTQICTDVWMPNTTAGFILKVETLDMNGNAVNAFEPAAVNPSAANTWETVCVDYANNASGLTEAHRLVFFFNITATPAAATSYYFDNVEQQGTATNTTQQFGQAKIAVFPNPATHDLYYEGAGEPMNIYISDVTGRMVRQWSEYTEPKVRVSDLTTGMYFITFINEKTGAKSVAKFMKQ